MTPRWRDLPRTTRGLVQRLAENGYPHPDPAIQRAAADWGARARRHQFWMLPFMPFATMSAFLPHSLRYSDSLGTDLLVVARLFGVAIVLVGWAVWFSFSGRHAERVERANTEALLNAVHRPSDEPFVAHRRLLVPSNDVAVITWSAFVAVFTTAMLRGVDEIGEDAPSMLVTALTPWAKSAIMGFGLGIAGIYVAGALITPRGRGALVAMDAAGVTIPHLGLSYGWADVDRVDFGHQMSLAFRLRDADGVLSRAQPKPWRRWEARHLQGVLAIPAVQLPEPIAEVVAKARALHSASFASAATR